MRTRVYIAFVFVAVITILIQGLFIRCKKDTKPIVEDEQSDDEGPKPGFAPGYPVASGFFYSDVGQFITQDSSAYEWRISGLAVFKEPAKKLDYDIDPDRNIEHMYANGDQSMGEITINEYPLILNDYDKLYKGRPQQPMPPDTSIRWCVQGSTETHNQTLFDDFFSQPFPKFNPAKSTYPHLLRSQDYKLEVSDYFFNYDSIWMTVPMLDLVQMKPGTNFLQFETQRVKYAYPHGYDSVRAVLKASKYFYAKHAGRYYQYIFVTKFPISVLFMNQ